MASTEKKWLAIAPQSLTSNGTIGGLLTVADTSLFRVKMKVILKSNTQPETPDDDLEIKRIFSKTLMQIGPKGNIEKKQDLTPYLVADGATIEVREQVRPEIDQKSHERAVYEEEPIMAKRVINVDEYGEKYTVDNPFPVQLSDGSINIGTVNAELEVQLSHIDGSPDSGDIHDSVRIGDGEDQLGINSDGSINVNIIQSTDSTEKTLNIYNEVINVIAGVETVLVNLIISAGKTYQFQRVQFSGEQISLYKVYINNIPIASSRTHHGSGLSGNIEFTGAGQEGISVVSGDVIELRTLHNRPGNGDFEGRIQLYEAIPLSPPIFLITEFDETLITEFDEIILME